MKALRDLLDDVRVLEIVGDPSLQVGEPEIDSRKVAPNGVFIALRGRTTDGHKFIDKAIQSGASAVICEEIPATVREEQVVWIRVVDSADAAGKVAHSYFDKPTRKLRLVGITGTNGKTSTATMLYQVMMALGERAGLLSTVENRIAGSVEPATHTTPDPVSLNRLLAKMVAAGCTHASMEVSSHAIDQKRISGLEFAGAVFTNITHDHLDYHGTFRHYLETKKKLFDGLGAQAFALVNVDDPRGEVMTQNTKAKVSKYSLRKMSDFKARILGNDISGLHLRIGETEMMTRLTGQFNAYNILAVYGSAVLLGFDPTQVLTALSAVEPVAGRFEVIAGPARGISAVVDYAHTPDALQNVLGTLVKVKNAGSRIIVVVGCGGDRDKAKRPVMARIAAEHADQVILTSDNPRHEDPEAILDDMLSGIAPEQGAKVLRITDRESAIRTGIKLARRGDIILVAGKGHENYQEIRGERFPFDDRKVVRDALHEDI